MFNPVQRRKPIKAKIIIQLGSVGTGAQIVKLGSEFDKPDGKNISAELAAPNEDMEGLMEYHNKGEVEAKANNLQWSSFVVGPSRDEMATIVRVKLSKDPRDFTLVEGSDGKDLTSCSGLTEGAGVMVKATLNTWQREKDDGGHQGGITLYANRVCFISQMNDFNKGCTQDPRKLKRDVDWD